jgi:hypothetical protein
MSEEKRVVRPHADEAVWRDRVERWAGSGLTGKEFAAKEDLSPRSLSWWRWRLRRTSLATSIAAPKKEHTPRRKRTTKALSFVPVVVGNARSADAPAVIEIILPNHLRIRVTAEIDETSLTRVVRALGAA